MAKTEQIFTESDPRRLTDETPIWRYVPLHTLFFYLNGSVFLPSIDKLQKGDPFEGSYYDDIAKMNEAFDRRYGNQAGEVERWIVQNLFSEPERRHYENTQNQPGCGRKRLFDHYFEFISHTRFAWCWFESEHESAAMWKVYGHQGAAVKTTIGKLRNALGSTGQDFVFARIAYADTVSDLGPNHETHHELLTRPFFLKRKAYGTEHEVRFVTSDRRRPDRDGLSLSVSPNELIEAIRLWPWLADKEADVLTKTIEAHLKGVDCRKSQLVPIRSTPPEFLDYLDEEIFDASPSAPWDSNRSRGVPAELQVV